MNLIETRRRARQDAQRVQELRSVLHGLYRASRAVHREISEVKRMIRELDPCLSDGKEDNRIQGCVHCDEDCCSECNGHECPSCHAPNPLDDEWPKA